MDSVIQFEGTIYEDGYGLLAQRVMRDTTLPKQSKLIYAYMCSFAGVKKDGERTAFPSIKLQCHELGLTEDTYYKWRKHLIDKGYIKIKKQRKEGAKFDNNIYSIVAVPVETKEKEPTPKKSGTDKKPYPKKSRTVKSSTENQGTNSNSFNSNSFKKEEEEEIITQDAVIAFMDDQITKREITNAKTIMAILEVSANCKAIGTNNIESMRNYCIKVVEEKMAKLGQKQKQPNKPSGKQNTSAPKRKEYIPNHMQQQMEELFDLKQKEEEEKRKALEALPDEEKQAMREEKQREIDNMLEKIRG